MSSSYENFQSKFVDEAFDNINDLEQALMALELSPTSKELIERVFRALHSLKGGGAMFGFERLSEFTHRLENIYEMVRSGQLCASSPLLSATLQSVDLIRDLLDVSGEIGTELKQRCSDMEKAIDQVVRDETEKMITAAKGQECGDSPSQPSDNDKGMATYFIHFYPGPEVMKNGTNLFYLLDDLKSLGQIYAIPGLQTVPEFHELEPSRSYIFWDIFLATEEGINAIYDVFIFVENESTIEVHRLSRSDLFQNNQFIERLNELSERQKKIDLSEISQFAGHEEANENSANADNPENSDEINTSLQDARNNEKSAEASSKNGRRSSGSIRVSTEKIDGLMDLVSEMVITQERLNMIAGRHQIPELKMVTETVQKLTSQLRDSTFSISLIPLETLSTRFQRLVLELGREMGKSISLQTDGLDTELDRTMIESLTDPLLHVIRNSIDHGIEMPEERKRNGKPEEGTIEIRAFYSGANVIIQIMDDGKGVDPEKVFEKSVEKGLVKADEHLSDQEKLNLVFRSGFSTSDKVTEVSGRGVGMDVVMQNISAIRGEVNLNSEKGKGTTVTISLPLVLSIIDGLLVRINDTRYVIPLSLTDKIYPVKATDVANGFNNIMWLGEKQMSFFDLREELQVGGKPPEKMQMVAVNFQDVKVALAVDQVIGKIQAVLKPLGKMYHDQKLISAATIMGDGTIALVLDVNALIREGGEIGR
ncbi:MAG: chemotaxis protein CheA [Bacteroidota bacterium]